jgi:hypothetical protein
MSLDYHNAKIDSEYFNRVSLFQLTLGRYYIMKNYSIFEDIYNIYLIRFIGFSCIDRIDYIHYNIILERTDNVNINGEYIVGTWNNHIENIKDGDDSYEYKHLYSYDITNVPPYIKFEFYIPKKFQESLKNKFWNVSVEIPDSISKNEIIEMFKIY